MKSLYRNQFLQLQKFFFLFCVCIANSYSEVVATQYKLSNGAVSFTLPSPIGKLQAVNQQMAANIESSTGLMQFQVSIDDFSFVTPDYPAHINAITTKRFHEYYMNDQKFPQAQFKGSIVDLKKVNFRKEGIYPVSVKGKMTIRGITQEIAPEATIQVKNGSLYLKSSFILLVNDYKVPVPEVLRGIFFKEVHVIVDCVLQP